MLEFGTDLCKLVHWVDYSQGATPRRSLICRAGRGAVARAPHAYLEAIERLHARALAVPAVNQGDLGSPAPMPFRLPDGAVLQVSEPMIKAVLVSLARAWPGAVTLEGLLQSMRTTLPVGEHFAGPQRG